MRAEFDKGPQAKKALATQLGKVMSTQGFIVCKGHGFSEPEIERITNIGWVGSFPSFALVVLISSIRPLFKVLRMRRNSRLRRQWSKKDLIVASSFAAICKLQPFGFGFAI